jgi:hypothetical protein
MDDYLDSPTGELAAVGSTWLLSDETGTARTLAKYTPGGYWEASHRDFDAFGDSREWRGTPVDSDLTSTPDNLVRGNDALALATFPRVCLGGYYDEAAGLYQLGGSWYDPLTGRFAQDRGSENGYALSGDAPYRDRFGKTVGDNSYALIRGLVGDERLAGASDAAVIGGTVAAAVRLGRPSRGWLARRLVARSSAYRGSGRLPRCPVGDSHLRLGSGRPACIDLQPAPRAVVCTFSKGGEVTRTALGRRSVDSAFAVPRRRPQSGEFGRFSDRFRRAELL